VAATFSRVSAKLARGFSPHLTQPRDAPAKKRSLHASSRGIEIERQRAERSAARRSRRSGSRLRRTGTFDAFVVKVDGARVMIALDSIQLRGEFPLRHPQVVRCLEIHPEPWTAPQEAREPERRG